MFDVQKAAATFETTYFESRMTQFCARRPSMTDSSLTFLVLTYRSSIEPVSFCTETKEIKNKHNKESMFDFGQNSKKIFSFSPPLDTLVLSCSGLAAVPQI